jgi:2-polyprenyl-3-methyl-5-hydroxy-6-metoxy-1,4-benzoquinol methylase
MMARPAEFEQVEHDLLEVYQHCPPTRTFYSSERARLDYRKMWGEFLASFGVPPHSFEGRRVLDVGCGSGEKASFYSDWGARVTGIDLTPRVLELARDTVGSRPVELLNLSLFDLNRPGEYDIAIVDGVSFLTADTFEALKKVTAQLKPGGVLVFSVTNVWGTFWWFRLARFATNLLGGKDFHSRAAWGRRLFLWTRESQEGTAETSPFYRNEQSWAYDWFGPPRYYLHSPSQLRRWLVQLELEHLGSSPSLMSKDSPRTRLGRLLYSITGIGATAIDWYWLVNRAPNMAYVAATKRVAADRDGQRVS